MAWALLVLGTIAVAELFLRLPIAAAARGILGTARRAQRTIRSARISDHWKEKVLLAYAARLFAGSLRIFGLVVLAVLPLALLAGLGAAAGIDLGPQLTRLPGILVSVAVACGYVVLRRRARDV